MSGGAYTTEVNFDRRRDDARLVKIEDAVERLQIGGLRRKSAELVGPCPRCGGTDRFAVNVRKQLFNCRGCQARGDVISLVLHVKGCSFGDAVNFLVGAPPSLSRGDAARETAKRPGIEPCKANGHGGSGTGYSKAVSPSRQHRSADDSVGPTALPVRTTPDADGRPKFFAGGDDGPLLRDEIRRHVYSRDGLPVRIKIKHQDGRYVNWYRVVDGAVKGWQCGKPDGYVDIPYLGAVDPFDRELLNDLIYWPEGEKDVETLGSAHLPAFTFGGTGDGLPEAAREYVAGQHIVILADNDERGRRHAEQKAALALEVAASVRVVHFPELPEKHDVSNWLGAGHNAEELDCLARKTPVCTPSPGIAALDGNVLELDRVDAPPLAPVETRGSEGISLDDFYSFMPTHSYIFMPSRELWPGSSVNARMPPVPVVDAHGRPLPNKNGEQKLIPATTWLDKNHPIEQMTWAPGFPELIRNRLISEGGWIERNNVTCLNLYRPPSIKLGSPMGADPWICHVRKIFPNDADHIIKWLAHRVQRPEEKINHALVLGGNQGIGKDTLLEPIKHAVGPWNFTEVSPVQMLGRFNGFVKSVILRISEVRDLGDVNRFQFYDHLKVYTAAPPDVLRVDEKNLREHSVFNICGVIITTNHKADGIYLPADDRRHYVAWSDLSKDDFTESYWKELWRWFEQGGHGYVAAYLNNLDLSDFNPKSPPSKTAAFWDIVDANRAPEDAELADVLDRMGNPDATTLSRITNSANDDFTAWITDRKNRRAIPHRLERCGYVPVRNDAAKDGLWKINGQRQVIYAKASIPMGDRLRAARELTGGQ
jgi:Family of unknown function (DUF5906)/CHC2 zinc finger